MVPPMKTERTLAERWLWLSVFALGVAGLYSLVPVIGRTPQLKGLPIMQQFFDVALVVHVDLSVLVWFLAMLAMGTAWVVRRHQVSWPFWGKAGWWTLSLSALLMAFAPMGEWMPIKSNYVPVLHNGIFLLALGLFAAGLLATFIPVVVTFAQPQRWRLLDSTERGWVAGGFVVILALIGFYLSARVAPADLPLLERYESLFWGGGHILQFSFALIAMASWLLLLEALGAQAPKREWVNFAYILTVGGAIASLAGYAYAPDSPDFTYFQTRIMREAGGIGPSLLAVLVVLKLCKTKLTHATRGYAAALICSLVLFFAGGGLGLMIMGQNVTIPAHYHGMIVGITMALMGVAYAMLPEYGYASVASRRIAFLQPILYAVGQLMHIGGLAYCGGYGILRKTAGGFENLAPDIKIALGIFGLGGLLAITGGILFVIVMLRASVSRQP